MEIFVREIKEDEYAILKEFLYLAIFVPMGETPPEKSIVDTPELQVYTSDFGKTENDCCLVAEQDGEIVGAVWIRIMNDFGHIDDKTPSFAISVKKEYQNKGIGSVLMEKMLKKLKKNGFKRASLSVQKKNYAVKMYQRLGFKIVFENDEEYIMVIDLRDNTK